MAHQQAYQAYPQNKGTLIPGQSISVNNYTVQVERYLSQGGFAHVYLVRTPQPVYNTTHHVLKRIAVANESMLTDVKKERLLKGHPNIVHLIDASWHKLPNGTFEVFILMEFCPGGGIIDMMNRRLRERLTEAEILQIFENILQSSPTSFKLCDFGSATTVSNPPTNMQEIRALEAISTGIRPCNTALLKWLTCTQTSDQREERSSMLREHGAQRPTVFELLTTYIAAWYKIQVHLQHAIPSTRSITFARIWKAYPVPSPNPMEGVVTVGGAPSSVPNVVLLTRAFRPETGSSRLSPHAARKTGCSREQNVISRPASPQNLTNGARKGMESSNGEISSQANYINVDDAAWSLDKPSSDARKATKGRPWFGDDFAESLWTAPDPNLQAPSRPRQSPSPTKSP
ncbi:kinase-like domain-containing protein [Pholiota molesta]|nr:kinase-like domain-containing protein [Pholiota molesta]